MGAAAADLAAAGLATGAAPHQGTQGKRALFLATHATDGVITEITGA